MKTLLISLLITIILCVAFTGILVSFINLLREKDKKPSNIFAIFISLFSMFVFSTSFDLIFPTVEGIVKSIF